MKSKLKPTLLLMVFVPLVAALAATLLITTFKAKSLVAEQDEKTLNAAVQTMKHAYDSSAAGEYRMDEDGKVYKGDYCISDDTAMVDDITEKSGCVATFFWGNTRVMTSIKDDSGKRIIGTTTTDENVLTNVLQKGETYFNSKLPISGKNYYVVYAPVFKDTGSKEIIGMVFMGIPSEEVDSGIRNMMLVVLLAAVVILIVVSIVAFIVANGISGSAEAISANLDSLADGDFSVEIDERILERGDELGEMGRATDNMIKNLKKVLEEVVADSNNLFTTSETLDKMANETATTISSVESAVSDIAAGATSQADDTTKASQNVMDMGQVIQNTVDDVDLLTTTADKMADSGRTAMEILAELKEVNERAIRAIDTVYEQTNITNESARKIHEATDIIASIAEETNLLSLNASIEAARAGDAGRGFAVVADQIQKLAEQSNNSAQDIEKITKSLIEDSDKSVSVMKEVKDIMNLQFDKMNTTGEAFDVVSEGIEETKNGVDQISRRAKKLDDARNEIIDIIQSLTAIAEENAASTQETSAATAEVSAAADSVSKSVIELKEITKSLENSISGFRF